MTPTTPPPSRSPTSIGALVVTFLLITPIAGTLLGFNWTQAVLIGGFSGSVAVLSAWLTARRASGE